MSTKRLLAKELLPELLEEGVLSSDNIVDSIDEGGARKIVSAEVIKNRDAEIQNELDNKANIYDIDESVIVDITADFSTDPSTPRLRLDKTTIGTKAQSSYELSIPLANPTDPGLMPAESVRALDNALIRISVLEDGYLEFATTTNLSVDATQAELMTEFHSVSGISGDPSDATRLLSIPTGLYWRWQASSSTWIGPFNQTIMPFTNDTFGSIKGENVDGKVYAEADGTGSIVGWSELKTRVSNIQQELGNIGELLDELNGEVI